MTTPEEEPTWDEATATSGVYVRVKPNEEPLRIGITNWTLQRVNKFSKENIEFVSDVVWENGVVVEKKFTTLSPPLKRKLALHLSNRKPDEIVYLNIMRFGSDFKTDYSVKVISPTE